MFLLLMAVLYLFDGLAGFNVGLLTMRALFDTRPQDRRRARLHLLWAWPVFAVAMALPVVATHYL